MFREFIPQSSLNLVKYSGGQLIVVDGRLRHDTNMILKAQNIMESLMVSTMQELSVIEDYIKEGVEE